MRLSPPLMWGGTLSRAGCPRPAWRIFIEIRRSAGGPTADEGVRPTEFNGQARPLAPTHGHLILETQDAGEKISLIQGNDRHTPAPVVKADRRSSARVKPAPHC